MLRKNPEIKRKINTMKLTTFLSFKLLQSVGQEVFAMVLMNSLCRQMMDVQLDHCIKYQESCLEDIKI